MRVKYPSRNDYDTEEEYEQACMEYSVSESEYEDNCVERYYEHLYGI